MRGDAGKKASARDWPHDEGLELALLGAIMKYPDTLDSPGLDERLFYLPNHTVFYRALKTRRDAGESTDPSFMVRPLVDRGIQGPGSLIAQAYELGVGASPSALIRDLSKLAARRQQIRDAETLARVAREGDLDPETLGTLHDRMGDLLQDARDRRPARFRILDAEAVANLPAPAWLVDRILPEGFSVLYGTSGSGKTFLTLGMALSVASGLAWLDRGVRAGAVAYVAAEGVAGLGVRLRAWREWTQLTAALPLHFVTEAVNLLEREAVEALSAQLRPFRGNLRLVVFDTWARCLIGGDENAAEDTGKAIFNLDRLRNDLGCSVLVVHHTPKGDATVERGSTALRGAADAMISVQADGGGELTLRCEKQKDAEPFEDLQLRLRTVEIGGTNASCVVDLVAPTADGVGASVGARKALEALVNGFDEEGASYSAWEKVANQAPRTFARHVQELRRAGLVDKEGKKRTARYLVTPAGVAVAARCQTGATAANGTGHGSGASGASAYRAGTLAPGGTEEPENPGGKWWDR